MALPFGRHWPLFDGVSCDHSGAVGAGAGASLWRWRTELGRLNGLLGDGRGAGGGRLGVGGRPGAHLLLRLEVPRQASHGAFAQGTGTTWRRPLACTQRATKPFRDLEVVFGAISLALCPWAVRTYKTTYRLLHPMQGSMRERWH